MIIILNKIFGFNITCLIKPAIQILRENDFGKIGSIKIADLKNVVFRIAKLLVTIGYPRVPKLKFNQF